MSPDRGTAVAAAAILIGFGLGAFFLPDVMLFVGAWSPWAAGAVAVVFVAAFFGVFWLRGRNRAKAEKEK